MFVPTCKCWITSYRSCKSVYKERLVTNGVAGKRKPGRVPIVDTGMPFRTGWGSGVQEDLHKCYPRPQRKNKELHVASPIFSFFFARRFQRGERDWQAGDASPEERLDWPAAQRCSVGCLPKGALHQEPLIWAMITARRCGVGRRRAQRSEHVPSGRKTRQENSHILELNKRESIGAD